MVLWACEARLSSARRQGQFGIRAASAIINAASAQAMATNASSAEASSADAGAADQNQEQRSPQLRALMRALRCYVEPMLSACEVHVLNDVVESVCGADEDAQGVADQRGADEFELALAGASAALGLPAVHAPWARKVRSHATPDAHRSRCASSPESDHTSSKSLAPSLAVKLEPTLAGLHIGVAQLFSKL